MPATAAAKLAAAVSTITLASPAKLNLMLAVTGRRPDGFHELVSVVAPVAWGDTLTVEPAEHFRLECADPAVPRDESNLVLKAAEAFRAASGWRGGAIFRLEKRIPIGAGLGGGSSNAATALRALNRWAPNPLGREQLAEVAAQVGSDCPLFLHDGPVVMRGRGEKITPLPEEVASRLRGRKVLIFKPAFGIATAWAYAQLAAHAPRSYMAPDEAEARVAVWMGGDLGSAAHAAKPVVHPAVRPDALGLDHLLYNSMEAPAFRKFPALPLLLELIDRRFGLVPRLSGSGSACFAFLPEGKPAGEIIDVVRSAWGESAFAVQTHLA